MLKIKWENEFKETENGFEIPREWQKKKIKQIGTVITGKTPPSKEKIFWGDKYPFVTPTDIKDFNVRYSYEVERFLSEEWLDKSKALLLDKDSVCFVCIGSTIGKMCLLKEPSFTNQQINSIIVNEENDSKFIYYLLKCNQEKIKEEFGGGGAAKDIISKSTFENIELPVPQLEEQYRIATVLSWFDALTENKKKQNEILENTAMAIFKSWFIDFEPFKNEELVDSELGKIPKGWKVKNLGDEVKFLYGKGLPENKREKGSYPVVGSSGIIGYHSKYLVSSPSIVVGRKGNVGSLYLLLEPSFPIDTTFYSSDRTFPDLIFYVYYFLKNVSLEDIGLSHTAVPGLDIHFLNSVKITFPLQAHIEKFHSIVEPLSQKILLNKRQIIALEKIRDALLPLLVFGKLRVEEI